MPTVRIALLLCLGFFVAEIRGQDFDLGDAFDEPPPTPAKPVPPKPDPATKAPAPQPKPAGGGDEFDLGDALGGGSDHATKKPAPQPNPGNGGNAGGGGGFGDDDLAAAAGGHPSKPINPSGRGANPSGDGGQSHNGNAEEPKPGVLAGIISAVGVAVVGAASGFFAYQKKKLCFKGQEGDPENVNMEVHAGDKAEPQVERTLLQR